MISQDGIDPSIAGHLLINSRYQIISNLGRGAYGTVYKCRDTLLGDQIVALKFYRRELFENEITKERINRELQIAYALRHQNIVSLIDCVREGPFIGFSMEYVDGGTLFALNQKKTLSTGEIVLLLISISQGLQAIHDAGVVHRDLKLENILLSKTSLTKISDFGVSAFVSAPTELTQEIKAQNGKHLERKILSPKSRLTREGAVIGTLDYIAPELFVHNSFDTRSDLYAIGIILYELIYKKTPFAGLSGLDLICKKAEQDIVLEPSLNYPEALLKICERLCARDPEQRIQSASDLIYNLKKVKFDSSEVKELPEKIRSFKKETTKSLETVNVDTPYAASNADESWLKERVLKVVSSKFFWECAGTVLFCALTLGMLGLFRSNHSDTDTSAAMQSEKENSDFSPGFFSQTSRGVKSSGSRGPSEKYKYYAPKSGTQPFIERAASPDKSKR